MVDKKILDLIEYLNDPNIKEYYYDYLKNRLVDINDDLFNKDYTVRIKYWEAWTFRKFLYELSEFKQNLEFSMFISEDGKIYLQKTYNNGKFWMIEIQDRVIKILDLEEYPIHTNIYSHCIKKLLKFQEENINFK